MRRKIAESAATLVLIAFTACGDQPERTRTGAPDQGSLAVAPEQRGIVLMLGTSLTEGLGVDVEESFPALLQRRIDSTGLAFRVVNAGVSGETAAGGLRRLEWLLSQPLDVLVLELGANDGLRGNDVDSLHATLSAIIRRTRAAYPDASIVIAGMEAPPEMGVAYTERFRRTFPDLADLYGAKLIPFLLAGVGGVDSLTQVDGIHPTARGHAVIANNVWGVLQTVLEARPPRPPRH